MYQIGEKVVYGIHGVCAVTDLAVKTVDRQQVRYYVLEPLEHPGDCYYIPTDKPAAVAKLSPLLSRKELVRLLEDCHIPEGTWIQDENQRKLRYRELITGCDRPALFAMVRALRAHKAEQLAQGRKFHSCDENFLRDAEKLLCAEFSVVLEISQQEAAAYMEDCYV